MGKFRYKSRREELKDSKVGVGAVTAKESPLSVLEMIEREYDMSASYAKLVGEIRGYVGSLELMLFHVEKITGILGNYISECSSSCLRIIQCFVREVRHEMYPYFSVLLKGLEKLCDKEEFLEEVFETVSIMLKYMVKGINNYENVFGLFDGILRHTNYYVRYLCCQSLSFLIKKTPLSLLVKLIDKYDAGI